MVTIVIWCRCFGLSNQASMFLPFLPFGPFLAWQLFWQLFKKMGNFVDATWPKIKEKIAEELTYLSLNIGSPVVDYLTHDPKN